MTALFLKPFRSIQSIADKIGMYRVVSGTLGLLALISIIAGGLGLVVYGALEQIFAVLTAIVIALGINWVMAKILKVSANHESAIITALILFFLALPGITPFENWPLWLAVAVGILSKYLIVYKKQHLLNPAAFGAAALSVTGIYKFSWWIANPVLFIPLLLLGMFVVMKVRRWVPVLTFIGVSLVIFLAEGLSYGDSLTFATKTFFISWPTLFLAFYMLTEPFTMPATKQSQFLYGGIVAFLSNASIVSLVAPVTPELALVIANVLMVPWRLKQKLHLELIERREIAKDTYEFIFKKPAGFNFKAGQYLEWMLPHEKPDSRGIRRYFTIASAPTEAEVRLAMRVVEKGSSYKNGLMDLDIGDIIIASQLSGDFVLPKNAEEKLGFIAGGIGITPFRSHLRYMQDSGKVHDTVLYYCNNTTVDMAYKSDFVDYRESIPFIMVPVISREELDFPYESGYFSEEMLVRRTPDYLERHWYISGPPGMVNACTATLSKLGVKKSRITKDFFPGLA